MEHRENIIKYGVGWRHGLAILAFFGFFNTYMLRVNMNVAIVAMVNHTAVHDLYNNAYNTDKDNSSHDKAPACVWNKTSADLHLEEQKYASF